MKVFCHHDGRRVFNARANIINLEIGVIVLHDFIKRDAFLDQFKHILYRDARAGNTRFTKMDMGVNGDSVLLFVTSLQVIFVTHYTTVRAPSDARQTRTGGRRPKRAW